MGKSHVSPGKKKIRLKHIIISIISILCATILFFAAQYFTLYHEFPVPYSENILSSEKISARDILQNSDYYFTHIIVKTIEGQNIAYIYYTATLWDTTSPTRSALRDYSDIIVHRAALRTNFHVFETIEAIYYFVGDYEKLMEISDDEFFAIVKNAVLIWDK